jgi:hypothetical protein
MTEQPQAASRPVNAKQTVMLTVLGIAMLVLCRTAVHSRGVADITWFLKLVVTQTVIYLAAA